LLDLPKEGNRALLGGRKKAGETRSEGKGDAGKSALTYHTSSEKQRRKSGAMTKVFWFRLDQKKKRRDP